MTNIAKENGHMRHEWVLGWLRSDENKKVQRLLLEMILKPTPEGASFLLEILNEKRIGDILSASERIIMSAKAERPSRNTTDPETNIENFSGRAEVSPRDVTRILERKRIPRTEGRKARPSKRRRIPIPDDFYRLDRYLNDCLHVEQYDLFPLMRKRRGISVRVAMCLILGALEVSDDTKFQYYKSRLKKEAQGTFGLQFEVVIRK